MSQVFDLSPIAATISDAASAQAHAINQWKKAGQALASAGVTSAMLIQSTEKNPNDAYNESVYNQVYGFIVQGISARIKTLVLPSGKYTVAEMLSLRDGALRDIEDPVMKTMRREFQQQAQGTYMSRVRFYIDRALGVEIVREKKAKADEKATPSEDPIVILQGMINNATKMVDVTSVDRFQNAGLEMIALLRAHRKA